MFLRIGIDCQGIALFALWLLADIRYWKIAQRAVFDVIIDLNTAFWTIGP